MDTPVPILIDQVTGSLALTDPRAVNPSFMVSTTLVEVITGEVISFTFTTSALVDSLPLLSTAFTVNEWLAATR